MVSRNRPTYDFTNDYAYDGIVYGKAPGLLDAVTKVIGNDRLWRACTAWSQIMHSAW